LTYISPAALDKEQWQNLLGQLKGHFLPDGRVNLIGSNVGAEETGAELVFKLSKLIGVQVRAAVDLDVTDNYNGLWQTADPSMSQPPDPIPVPDSRVFVRSHTVSNCL